MVAAEGDEVSLPGRVESFQSPGHKASLRLRTSPLKPKDGLSGPPAGLRKERERPDQPSVRKTGTLVYRPLLYQIEPGDLKFKPSPQTAWVRPWLSMPI